jgi:hypothetical protein
MSNLSEAFLTVCNSAKVPETNVLSLYIKVPYYGGPEEGGWWGSDNTLVAYQAFNTEEELNAAKTKVEEMVEQLNKQARTDYGNHCLRQTEWLDARGLDDSYLPEVDGEESYFLVVEETPGSRNSRGCRHYE